ncbi:MAG: type II restriction endonuclease, partial [Firmicutes bacterium]|nr:type II restriction endonuclease [Bacillota bacterium]
RLASLALGTGDLDCVYQFALSELLDAVKEYGNHGREDIVETLENLVEGKRLKDISDLPLDLSV